MLTIAEPSAAIRTNTDNLSPILLTAKRQAAASQPLAPACPELLSLAVHCQMTVLPASLPLPACCAVTLETASLTLTRTRGDSLRDGTDREWVRSCAPAVHQLAASSRAVLLSAT